MLDSHGNFTLTLNLPLVGGATILLLFFAPQIICGARVVFFHYKHRQAIKTSGECAKSEIYEEKYKTCMGRLKAFGLVDLGAVLGIGGLLVKQAL